MTNPEPPIILIALAKTTTGYLNADVAFAYQQVQALMASIRCGDHEKVGGTSVESILDTINTRETETNADGFLEDLATVRKAATAAGVDEDFFTNERWNYGLQGFLIGLTFASLALSEVGAA